MMSPSAASIRRPISKAPSGNPAELCTSALYSGMSNSRNSARSTVTPAPRASPTARLSSLRLRDSRFSEAANARSFIAGAVAVSLGRDRIADQYALHKPGGDPAIRGRIDPLCHFEAPFLPLTARYGRAQQHIRLLKQQTLVQRARS